MKKLVMSEETSLKPSQSDKIIKTLKKSGRPLTRLQIGALTRLSSGGSLSSTLKGLELEKVIERTHCTHCQETDVYKLI